MPLDLKKVVTQLKSLGNQKANNTFKGKLESTWKLFREACENKEKLLRRIIEVQSSNRASFFFASCASENIDLVYAPDEAFKSPHIVIASDGSQISPSHHEISSAFLINVGLVAIPYFSNNLPVQLLSEPKIYPHIYNTQEEIRSVNIGENYEEEDLISYERTLKELEELAELAKNYTAYKLPIVALLDGTLIHWHLERFNKTYAELFIKRFSDAMHSLKSLGIPIAGFLSNSRSNDVINMLRLFKCPFDFVDCKKYCYNTNSQNLPCNPTPDYTPVFDRRLVEENFKRLNAKERTRTILFKSNNKILNYYPEDLKVFFFYMSTQNEVARIEVPSYVTNDSKLFDMLYNVISLQCELGSGYPLTLSEAHLQAVVTQSDRQLFYNLIAEQLIKNSHASIKLSNKEFRKRVSFV